MYSECEFCFYVTLDGDCLCVFQEDAPSYCPDRCHMINYEEV